jgi:sterol desaturase/sphingolipid hydroxylase (fatty acid hydroxylase superfamily)
MRAHRTHEKFLQINRVRMNGLVNAVGNTIFSVGVLSFFLLLVSLTKEHKNFEKREIDDFYVLTVCVNLIMMFFIVLLVFNFRSIFYAEGYIPRLSLLVFCFLAIDTLHYWMHRTCHRIPPLKKLMHMTHHEAVNLVPSDIFYMTMLDCLVYALILIIFPILFGVNIVEAFIVLSIALSHAIYIHSEEEAQFFLPGFISSSYHRDHHQIGRGNYAIFFSLWDTYMNTEIQTPRRVSLNKKEGIE